MTIKRLIGYVIMFAIVGGSMLLDTTMRVNAAFPGENGKIAFGSNRDDPSGDIFVMNGDGSGQTNLSPITGLDGWSVWSPDGSKIAFTSSRDGLGWEIFVMNADGSDPTQITQLQSLALHPSWSPDGSKIVFESSHEDPQGEIYVMNADGTGITRITTSPGYDQSPEWSPDGSKIAFSSNRAGYVEWQVYLMNPDGSGVMNVSQGATTDAAPSWSPDGSKIAFESDRDGNREIYSMNADGSGQVRLTENSARDLNACWSPDGTKIAFVSDRDGDNEIYVMNADGSGETNVSHSPGSGESYPNWQPLAPDNDTDDDGIPDDKDVETTQEAISGLPPSAFKGGDPGHARAMTNILDEVEGLIASGDTTTAIKRLNSLLTRVDGCGTKADKTDWIVDCTAQVEIRDLINTLITNLSS
ncbi:MAG TPA: DUF5050 domain-containing protein [Pyrinomonadaceae bacterium]